MMMLAFTVDDPTFVPSCSFYPETLRLQVPRKDDFFVHDVSVQATYISPELKHIAHRLALLCAEFDQEYFSEFEEPKPPRTPFSSFWKWIF